MRTRQMGRTGLTVSALCFGGNVFGWTIDEPASFAVLDAFVDGGGTFIDTADVYSAWVPGNHGGESETILGRWMRERGNRERIIVATKVASPMGPGPNDRGLSRHHIMSAVEASLRRLQTDYIDLYFAHNDDPLTPVDETMRAFDDLARQGKVRYLGASNFRAWRLTRALWESDKRDLARYDCVQPRYNLLYRDDYAGDLQALCLEQGIGVVAYSALGSGFFSGKYRRDTALPATARASGVQQRYMTERGFRVLDALEAQAHALNVSPAQVALAWLLRQPGITAPIVSATTPDQLRDLLGAADLDLPDAAVAALDDAGK